MRKDWELTEEAFNKFLFWLNPDRQKAGEKYEAIRRRLIIILNRKGCTEAEELTDETINRVIRRAQEMADTFDGEPIPYFITVANHLFLEYVAKRQPMSEPPDDLPQPPEADPEDEIVKECLDRCIQKLTPAKRDIVLRYYQADKQIKIDRRKRLADELGITLNALRLHAFRIRIILEKCIDECLTKGQPMK